MQASGTTQEVKSANPTPCWNTAVNNAIDIGLQSIDTLTSIVKEVAEVLDHAPLVKTITGVILQIIKIRNEIKDNKERCLEIIDKVLDLSKWICNKLRAITKSGERVKENLAQMENSLEDCKSTLEYVLLTLQKHQSRNKLKKLINRGIGDLDKLDRSVDNLEKKLHRDISFDTRVELGRHTSSQNINIGSDPSPGTDGHVLPPKPDSMVERESQLDSALKTLLGSEPARIAILGGGGFGKTTLARWILHDSKIINYYERRYFLSCEGVNDADTLLATLGTMLNIKVAAPEMLASIRRLLETSRTLLCLDNFETPWEASATRTKIEEVLESIVDIPKLSLIVTLRGIQRPSKVAWSKPLLEPLSALSLDGAKSILHNIAGNQNNSTVTEQLLQAIDGIPLAVTLASTLIRDGESVESLWRRWSKKHTKIIHTGVRDRQSDLNASIFLSVESGRMKSSPDAIKLLAALSLLPYGFPSSPTMLEDLQKYLRLGDDIHSALETLRIVALIKVDATNTSQRLQMLSTIRLYCNEFLSSEISLALEGVVEYYEDILIRFSDPNNAEAYPLIVPDILNIHTVFQKGYIAGYSEKSDFKLVTATVILNNWSRYIGYYAKETTQIALDRSPRLSLPYTDLLLSLGIVYRVENDNKRAEKLLREAIALSRQHHSYTVEAFALFELGIVLFCMGQSEKAAGKLEKSLRIYLTKKPEDLLGQGNTLGMLGEYNMAKGQFRKAQEYFTTALEAFRISNDSIGHSDAALCLCKLHIRLDNLVEAERFATASLDAAKKIKYGRGEGRARLERAILFLSTGRITDARLDLEQAVPILKQHSPNDAWFQSIDVLGRVYIQLDRLAEAETLLTQSIQAAQHSMERANILSTLGWIYTCTDRPDKAEARLHEALDIFQKFQDKYRQARVLAQLGRVYFQTKRLEDAARVLESIPNSMGIWEYIETERLWVLGDLYIVKGKVEEAEILLNSAMNSVKSSSNLYNTAPWISTGILRSIGTLHSKCGRIDSGIEKFKEALEIHRKVEWVSEQATDLKWLGEAYQTLGRFEEAKAVFSEAETLMETIFQAGNLPP